MSIKDQYRETYHRTRKASALARFLRCEAWPNETPEVRLAALDALSPVQWTDIADAIGVRPPSPQTIGMVRVMLEAPDLADTADDPFAGI